MARMKIFNTLEQEVFESPPVFNSAERKHFFTSSSRSLFFNYLILNGNFLRCNPDYTEKILINQDTGNC